MHVFLYIYDVYVYNIHGILWRPKALCMGHAVEKALRHSPGSHAFALGTFLTKRYANAAQACSEFGIRLVEI